MGGGVYRSAYLLAESVQRLAKQHGLERLGFLTLTFADPVKDVRVAQRRFNSLATHVLRKRYAATVACVERQKSGRLHFHLVVVLQNEVRSGFDFEQAAKGVYRSANGALRSEWAFWRKTAPKYRFGRTELLPIRSTAEAIGKYVGKYLAKHIGARIEADKGARLVRYSKGARAGSTRFAWAGKRGWLWRAKLARWAQRNGFASEEGIRAQYGAKWAFRLARVIAGEVLTEYPTIDHARADGVPVPAPELLAAASSATLIQTDGADGISLEVRWDSSGRVRVRVQSIEPPVVLARRSTGEVWSAWYDRQLERPGQRVYLFESKAPQGPARGAPATLGARSVDLSRFTSKQTGERA